MKSKIRMVNIYNYVMHTLWNCIHVILSVYTVDNSYIDKHKREFFQLCYSTTCHSRNDPRMQHQILAPMPSLTKR